MNVLAPRIVANFPQYDIIVHSWPHAIRHGSENESLTGIVQPKFTYYLLILKEQQQGDRNTVQVHF